MQIDTCHFEIHVHSLEAAQVFYVDKLGFELIQFKPELHLLAVKAGTVRISIFADASQQDVAAAGRAGGHIIFRTHKLSATIEALQSAGIDVPRVSEAPGFMKYISLRDPSGNLLEIAEYMRDPLKDD